MMIWEALRTGTSSGPQDSCLHGSENGCEHDRPDTEPFSTPHDSTADFRKSRVDEIIATESGACPEMCLRQEQRSANYQQRDLPC